MSCHDIGRGMNSVVKVIIDNYQEKKFDAETARELIAACRKGVYWCDGNQDEAIKSIRRCICGKCMQTIRKGEYLFSIWNVSYDVPDRYGIIDGGEVELASDGLCEKCFDEVINAHCENPEAGARERKYIIEHLGRGDYLSTGEIDYSNY